MQGRNEGRQCSIGGAKPKSLGGSPSPRIAFIAFMNVESPADTRAPWKRVDFKVRGGSTKTHLCKCRTSSVWAQDTLSSRSSRVVLFRWFARRFFPCLLQNGKGGQVEQVTPSWILRSCLRCEAVCALGLCCFWGQMQGGLADLCWNTEAHGVKCQKP